MRLRPGPGAGNVFDDRAGVVEPAELGVQAEPFVSAGQGDQCGGECFKFGFHGRKE